jgi:hypothetical protein
MRKWLAMVLVLESKTFKDKFFIGLDILQEIETSVRFSWGVDENGRAYGLSHIAPATPWDASYPIMSTL